MRAGTRIGAFRVERLIAAGSTGAVYEATQVSVRRTVALRLIDAAHFTSPEQLVRFDHEQRLAAALHHPNLVPLYEADEWRGGRFVATRLVRGKTLAELHDEGSPPGAETLAPLAGALEAAHAAGLVHGRVSERNILVEPDGTPYLADLGLGRPGSPQGDDDALAAVVSGLPARAGPARTRRASRPLALGLACLAVVAAVVLVLVLRGGDDDPSLARPLGCSPNPGPNTPACTLAQSTLDGRSATIPRAGVIRAWTVRGASGGLTLQVIRERRGRSFAVGFSRLERATGAAPRTFPADIAVGAGDRIGVRLAPGATVGARLRPTRSRIVRWDGGLVATPQLADATVAGELMLRADIEFGGRPKGARLLTGSRAASAPAGRRLGEQPVPLSARRTARIVVVELSEGIAIDVVRGRRLARLEVPDADPDGELIGLEKNCGPVGPHGFCLRWRNPGEHIALRHEYSVTSTGGIKLAS